MIVNLNCWNISINSNFNLIKIKKIYFTGKGTSQNRTTRIRHQCMETTVLSFHRCLINTGVKKMNTDYNFDHQMHKSKCWYSSNCLHY